MLCLARGFCVTGSDSAKNLMTQKLVASGVEVYFGHSEKNIKNVDIVIYSGAIKESNPELVEAKLQGLLIISRGEFLGEFSQQFKNVIAVSGAHGKTTTCAMLAEIFTLAGKNPTVHVGGFINKFSSNFVNGENEFLITEACEYQNAFLNLMPDTGVILNVEPEHLDFFGTYDNVVNAFKTFANQSNFVISNDANYINLGECFGNKNGYYSKNVVINKNHIKFECWLKTKRVGKFWVKAYGEHNVQNALVAIGVAKHYGIAGKYINKALKNFEGTKRRFQILQNNPLVIHDYAHHPTEIKTAILTMRKLYKGVISVIFQPHTYSRTQTLFNDFLLSLSHADKVVILPTYSAREQEIVGATGFSLAEKLIQKGVCCTYAPNFETADCLIKMLKKTSSVILILGAGDLLGIVPDI